MLYEKLINLNEDFIYGRMSPIREYITVGDKEYNNPKEYRAPMIDTIENHLNQFLVYEHKTHNDILVFVWRSEGNTLVPSLVEEIEFQMKEITENKIPDLVDIMFNRFGTKVQGRVDTGAKMSSMHADEYNVDESNRTVTFKSDLLKPGSNITMPYVDIVNIQTSEGKDDRPVIVLDITIGEEKLNRVKFNLNDRSGMKDKILVGQNILEQGKFLVDPNVIKDNMELTYDVLQEMYADNDEVK